MQMQKVKQELTFWHPRTHLQELFVDFLCKLVVNCHLQQAIRIDMKKGKSKIQCNEVHHRAGLEVGSCPVGAQTSLTHARAS